jgi:transposase
MDRPTSIPQHIWGSFSDEARAIVRAVVVGLERQVTELRQQVQDLKARLDQNSSNSSKPPSTDPIGVNRKRPEPPSKKR